jgi:hypothetical protein
VASPTGPYRRAIRDGKTGFLADHSEEWYTTLLQLVDDPALRFRVARAAQHDVLWRYGPLRRADIMLSALPQLHGNRRAAAHAFALEVHREHALNPPSICIPDAEIVFASDQLGDADVTVVVPLHNCTQRVEEALEGIRAQTLEVLDLIVVDDASTDRSLSAAVEWARRNTSRFNRLIVSRNQANAGAGPTRNAGIDAADTPWVLILNTGIGVLPECCAVCLSTIRASGAAFAYPSFRPCGEISKISANYSFDPKCFTAGNHAEFLALVSKEAWASVAGYTDSGVGGEDFRFCCRLVENGLWGCSAGNAPLAEHRVHGDAEVRATTQAGAISGRSDVSAPIDVISF